MFTYIFLNAPIFLNVWKDKRMLRLGTSVSLLTKYSFYNQNKRKFLND